MVHQADISRWPTKAGRSQPQKEQGDFFETFRQPCFFYILSGRVLSGVGSGSSGLLQAEAAMSRADMPNSIPRQTELLSQIIRIIPPQC